MSSGVQTPTALVATAECSVPNLLPFAIMGCLAVLQNLRKNRGVPLYILNERSKEVGHRAHLGQLKTQEAGLHCQGERATWGDRPRQRQQTHCGETGWCGVTTASNGQREDACYRL